MILCFELSMPNRGSWNGKWSGENDIHAILKTTRNKTDMQKFKELDGKDWFYRWDDGWTACVSARIIDSKQAAKVRRNNKGFCGYSWMVASILKCGKIMLKSDMDALVEGSGK